MGTVRSRQQAGDAGWQQTMSSSSSSSSSSKRRKLQGLSSQQDKARDPPCIHTGQHMHVSYLRKGDAKDAGGGCLSSTCGQQRDSLPSSSCSSRLSATSTSGPSPGTSSVEGVVCASQASSRDSATYYSCQCRSHGHQPPPPPPAQAVPRCNASRQLDNVLYQQFNLDTHPAVTCLQNEQNLRLEGMEQRMDKIRKNAQQEAERRKFAHLFRARTEEKLKAETLLREAGVALQVFKKERQQKKSKREKHLSSLDGTDTQNQFVVTDPDETQENDKGEIIPVQIVSARPGVSEGVQQAGSKAEAPLNWLLQPVERLELNGVVLWLVLPFLLPLLLLLHLLRHLSPSSDCHSSKKH